MSFTSQVLHRELIKLNRNILKLCKVQNMCNKRNVRYKIYKNCKIWGKL